MQYNIFNGKSVSWSNLKLGVLPKVVEFEHTKFVLKAEFHITLANAEFIAKSTGNEDLIRTKKAVLDAVVKYVEEFPFSQFKLLDDIRIITDKNNKTIVVLVRVNEFKKLFEQISSKVGATVPVQPAHITLYTLEADRFGIPINSQQDLKKKSVVVEIPVIKSALSL